MNINGSPIAAILYIMALGAEISLTSPEVGLGKIAMLLSSEFHLDKSFSLPSSMVALGKSLSIIRNPSPKMSPTKPVTEFFIERATEIVQKARKMGIEARIIGGLAILIHSMNHMDLFKKLNRLEDERSQITDIDLITYKSHVKKLDSVLTQLGYTADFRVMLYYGDARRIYHSRDGSHQIDVFIDRLKYNHTIELGKPGKGRLELDFPTIPLSDLLLEKLQIHKIAEKDIKDVILLLRAHEPSLEGGEDVIDLRRLQEVLGDDWGFWYESKLNLEKVLRFIEKYREKNILNEADARNVEGKVKQLLRFLEEMPKTRRWQKRAKIGEKKKWWNEIE